MSGREGLEDGTLGLSEKGGEDWLYEEDVYSTTDTEWRVRSFPPFFIPFCSRLGERASGWMVGMKGPVNELVES